MIVIRLNVYTLLFCAVFFCGMHFTQSLILSADVAHKPRVIVTSDGEIDDECSLVRFLLYANEWDIEGIITSSSQYHWQGHRWAGDDWVQPYLKAYAEVYPNLIKHDTAYPPPEYLHERTLLGNVKAEGEMEEVTPGSQRIVEVLLDDSDPRPVWLQAWGGCNTIARALKTIQEIHPVKMEQVSKKVRLFLIWEQDPTYQVYIRPNWEKHSIQTVICDQFWAIAYQWNKILPEDKRAYFKSQWMKANILKGHGALCSLYKAHVPGSHGLSGDMNFDPGDFRSEGDSPAFLHTIPTGLRNLESPGWGGWGGRYHNVRNNIWLDPVPESGYRYPEGRWYTRSAWGRRYMREDYPNNPDLMREYFKPLSRWMDAIQNDFAARADWCVQSFDKANHPPVVTLNHGLDMTVKAGASVMMSARGTSDPDGHPLSYRWWHYSQAGTYRRDITINGANTPDALIKVPTQVKNGETIHLICEVTDTGMPPLTRYQRVVVEIE